MWTWIPGPAAGADAAAAAPPAAIQYGPGMPLRGPRLVAATALAVGGMCAGLLLVQGTGLEGVRAVLRWTARTSALLFLAAFGAASLQRLAPGGASRWMLANRRYLGVSFGVSHAFHLAAVVALVRHPDAAPAEPWSLALGGLAYLFLAAMLATSTDRTAAWLGRTWWRRLHGVGSWYLWGVFAFTFLGTAAVRPLSAAFLLLTLAAAALRLAGRRVRRRVAA